MGSSWCVLGDGVVCCGTRGTGIAAPTEGSRYPAGRTPLLKDLPSRLGAADTKRPGAARAMLRLVGPAVTGVALPLKGILPRRRAAATKPQDPAWEHLPSGDRTTGIGSRILRGAVGCSIDAYDLFGDGLHERFVKRLTREPPSIKERAEQRGDHGG